jgi:hypothetical protein
MARTLTHREFKLLLKADHFPTKKSVYEFNDLLAKIAKDNQVHYDQLETINTQIRQVRFFDTVDQDLRKNHLILRLRQDQTSGWPDETWEVTFKCRSADYNEAAEFVVDSKAEAALSAVQRQRFKFKEEILRGEKPGSTRRIFSNNNVAMSAVKSFENPIGRLMEIFPGLGALELDPQKVVSAVNSARVFEVQANLGNFEFGKDATAPATLAVWMRPTTDAFNILVAEFGYSYHLLGSNPKQQQAHENADRFFKVLQEPLADWLFEGSTKTALVYGTDE